MPRKREHPKPGKPEVITMGNAQVKIYGAPVNGRDRFIVAHKGSDGKRKTQSFSKYNEAKLEAENLVVKIHNGTLDTLKLTGAELRSHELAAQIAAELQRPVNAIVQEFKEAQDLLPESVSITEAARFFIRHGHSKIEKRDLAQVVEDFISQLKTDGRSKRYLEDAQARLRKLAGAFTGTIDDIGQRDLQQWLNGLKVAGRTRNNYRALIIALFRYARGYGHLAAGLDTVAEGLRKSKEDSGEIGILTPAQMRKLLKNASERLIPLLTIGGFAGLRPAEIFRLDWDEVDFKQGHIEIKSGKAKTAQRRLAPMLPNLKSWLEPYRGRKGLVLETEELDQERRDLVEMLGMEWPHNALRHSYASYRLAAISDAAKVALEMGNSPQMIFRNYRKVVTDGEAKSWFKIMPK